MIDIVDEVKLSIKEANKLEKYKIESMIRALLSDEELASSHYLNAAQVMKDNGFSKASSLLNDLSNEEIVHVGELNKLLEYFKVDDPSLIRDGNKEAGNKLEDARSNFYTLKHSLQNQLLDMLDSLQELNKSQKINSLQVKDFNNARNLLLKVMTNVESYMSK